MDLCKDLPWCSRSFRPCHHVDLLGLLHLYQPIVGATGVSLYLTLYYQLPLHRAGVTRLFQHSFLLKLCSVSFKEMVEARYLLEGVGLLNCYEKKDPVNGHYYEYEIIPPLTPICFFQSDVLSLSLFNVLGKEMFSKIRNQFVECEDTSGENEEIENITKSFQEVFTSFSPVELAKTAQIVGAEMGSFSEQHKNEHFLDGKFPESLREHDFSLIKMRLSSVVDEEIWTDKLIGQLSEICFLYQLDEWDLLKALQNPYITHHGMIDLDRLRSFIKNEYRFRYGGTPVISQQQEVAVSLGKGTKPQDTLTEEEKHIQQLSVISPLELLTHYQGGAQIPKSDLELVDSLIHEYKLPYGVINVLLEYVLLKYDYRLPRNLVEKIAGHWKRLGIQTAETAMEQARKEDWDLKKKRTSKNTSTNNRKKNVKKERGSLPKAVQKQMEMKDIPIKEEEKEDDITKKKERIEAKLKMMHEKRNLRNNERENLS